MESIDNKYGITIGDVDKSQDDYGWFGTVIEGIDFFDDSFGGMDVATSAWFHLKRDAVAFVKREHKKYFPEQYKRKTRTIDVARGLSKIKIKSLC